MPAFCILVNMYYMGWTLDIDHNKIFLNIDFERGLYMDQFVKKYNEYIESVAPEIREELIFSPRVQKYLLITHYDDGKADVMVIENAEQLATEFMLSIAFHVGNSPEFKSLSNHEQKELMQQEILRQKELLSRYLTSIDNKIDSVCTH